MAGRSRGTAEEKSALLALGIDPMTPAAEVVGVLSALSKRPEADHIAVARALCTVAPAEAAAMLAGIETKVRGARRREVRRMLYRLRQRGIVPAEVADPVSKSSAPPVPTEPDLSALVSTVDAEGGQLVWLLKSRRQGGLRRLSGLVSEAEGLVATSLAPLSRRELRQEQRDLEARGGPRMVEADWRLADHILYDAYRRTPEGRRGRVGDFLAARAELIASPPAADFVHPVYREFAAEVAREPSVELLSEPEVAALRMPVEALRPSLEEIERIRESMIVLNRFQQEERVDAAVARALAELGGGSAAGATLRRRLEALAYYMARTGRTKTAGWVAAAAARLRDGADLRHVAFFQAFIRAQLGATLAQESREAEPRLVMTPAQAMRAQRPRPTPR